MCRINRNSNGQQRRLQREKEVRKEERRRGKRKTKGKQEEKKEDEEKKRIEIERRFQLVISLDGDGIRKRSQWSSYSRQPRAKSR